MAVENINRYLDHAVLKPELTRQETIEAIQLGIDYSVRTVCVRPCDIELAADMCKGTESEVSCVLSFPHGCGASAIKSVEARQYIEYGTSEIDMVVNYGFVRSAMWDEVTADIAAVTSVANDAGILVKVIFETSFLSIDEIRKTTECAIQAKAGYVKTSTGFAEHGATVEAVQAMLDTAAGKIKVKASGGIRDRETAEMYIEMGVERIGNGSSSTKAICEGAGEGTGAY